MTLLKAHSDYLHSFDILVLNSMPSDYRRVVFGKDKIVDCKDLVFMGQDLNSRSGG